MLGDTIEEVGELPTDSVTVPEQTFARRFRRRLVAEDVDIEYTVSVPIGDENNAEATFDAISARLENTTTLTTTMQAKATTASVAVLQTATVLSAGVPDEFTFEPTAEPEDDDKDDNDNDEALATMWIIIIAVGGFVVVAGLVAVVLAQYRRSATGAAISPIGDVESGPGEQRKVIELQTQQQQQQQLLGADDEKKDNERKRSEDFDDNASQASGTGKIVSTRKESLLE